MPSAGANGWAAHLGKAVTCGIRPEDVAPGRPGTTALTMKCVLVEPLGAERLFTFEREGLRVVARLSQRMGIENQQTVEVCFPMEHAHWFDRESGLALNQGRPAG